MCRYSLVRRRFLEHGREQAILPPHQMQDELCAVCDECNNAALKTSDFGCLVQTLQEVRPRPAPPRRRRRLASAPIISQPVEPGN